MNALFSVLAARHFDFDLTVVWMWLGCIKASSYSPTFHGSSRCRQWHWFLFRNFWIKYHLLVSNLSMGIRMRWKTVSDLDLSWILSQARNKKRLKIFFILAGSAACHVCPPRKYFQYYSSLIGQSLANSSSDWITWELFEATSQQQQNAQFRGKIWNLNCVWAPCWSPFATIL